MGSTNIQIAVKVRPLIERELKDKVEPLWLIKENSIIHTDNSQNFLGEPYSFDHIFDQSTSNKDVYDAVVKPLVLSCLEGINSTIFAYGQTSSGKTHTMLGDGNIPGIIMYTIQDIFNHIEETVTKNFLLRCSYLEIYNEKINDLLDTKAIDLKIREDYDQMVYVHAKEEVIREKGELFSIMKKGMKTRKIGCTDMNERSSRSHTIFKLVIQSQNKDSEGSYTESSLSLVDLAGSERVGQMNMKGERQTEGVCINKSLTTLGLVIRKLSENEQFINYRDSKLTRLLQHSLGGNSRTLIICTITVAAAEETKSTLEFAQRAKYVKNRPIINEKVTDKDQLKQYAHLCQDYKVQIEKLRLEKLEREKTINALEDKISNICLFTSGNIENNVNASKIPRRRHTLGYYKPFRVKSLTPMLNSEGSDESSDQDDQNKQDSPVKSNNNFIITDEDDKENVNIDTDSIASTPSKLLDAPVTTKETNTPSPILRIQKGLLEESYDSLKTFTNYEKQLLGQYDEIKELKELTNKLRSENIELKQQQIKESQLSSKVFDNEIFDQLVLLESILQGKPVEEIRRKSLHTITEEDSEMVSDPIDPTSEIQIIDRQDEEMKKTAKANEKCTILNEEIKLLNQQLVDKENIASSLNARWTNEKDKMEAKFTTLVKENEHLKNQLGTKNIKIDELETYISQHKDIKEAELEILTKKIKQLTEYKEEMHKQLSELQQSKDDYVKMQDTSLEQTECDQLSQLSEYNTFKNGELKEEKTSFEKHDKDISQNNRALESEKEIPDLRQVVAGLESELNALKFKYIELDNQHPLQEINAQLQKEKELVSNELLELNQIVILREKRIAELTNCQKNSNDKWDKYKQEFAVMREKYDIVEQEQVDRQKTIERLTQVEIEYTTITNHIRDVLGEDLDIIDYVNTYKALKRDNDNLKLKVESSEKVETELNDTIAELTRKLFDQDTSNKYLKASIDRALDEHRHEIKLLIDQSAALNEQLEAKLLELDTQQKQNNALNRQISEYNKERAHYSLLEKENNRKIKMLIDQSAALNEQLEATLLELDTQQKQNNVLNSQISEYNKERTHYSLLEKENNRLKSELEDVMFQLTGEQKEVEHLSQKLDEKSFVISDLEKKILQFNEHISLLKSDTASLQELSNINVTLRETIIKKEGEIKTLEENYRFSTSKLEQNTVQLIDNKEGRNNLAFNIQNWDVKSTQTEEEKEEIKTLEDKCLSQEHQLKNSKEQLNNTLKELNEKTEHYNNLVAKLNTQELQIESYKEQLNNKIVEFNDKSELYNNILTNYADRNCQIEYLETENNDLKLKIDQKRHEISDLRQLLTQRCDGNNILEKENVELKQRIDGYILQITTLENQHDNLKSQLNTKILEINKQVTKTDSLITEIADLKKELNTLSQKQLALESAGHELERLKVNNSLLKQQVDELGKDNINIRLELTELTTDLNKKQQQIVHLKDVSERQAREMKTLENDKTKLAEKMEASLKEVVNMKRQLDRSSGELSHLKGKYNALEVKFHDCKDTLRFKNQELENHKASKILESVTALKQAQEERNLKCNELKFASEKIEKLSRDVDNLQNELEQYKMKLQKIRQNYEGNITLLNGAIAKLTGEKQDIEKKLSKIENKIQLSGQILITENQRLGDQNQLEQELLFCKKYANDLESQLKLKKIEVVSLTKKVQQSEYEINNLQEKLSDLIQYKKRMQEKISDGSIKEMPLPRLSDEGRPLSPNELRKIKRQSIHDQRRGLVQDSSDSLDLSNIDCGNCKELRARLGHIEEKNKELIVEIDNLKKENVFLDGENEDMLKIIKDMQQTEAELDDQLQSYKKLKDFSSGDDELRLIQVKYDEVITKQTELENELLRNKELVARHKNTIADMESIHLEAEYKHDTVEKELRRQLDDYRSKIRKAPPSTEDKETQATCDLNERYKKVKKLAQIRRQEGNYLRGKLNLAPDCAVLPEDVQRQPTNV